jgi:hypothetical protein
MQMKKFVTGCSIPVAYRRRLYSEEGSGVTVESNKNHDRVKRTEVRVKLSQKSKVVPALFFNCVTLYEGVLREWRYSSTHS